MIPTEITNADATSQSTTVERETTLLIDRAVQFATAKKPTSFMTQCYVWEVSVLSQSKTGKVKFNELWKHLSSIQKMDRIDGEPMEFERKIPRIYNVGNSPRDSKDHDYRIKVGT